MTVTEIIKSSKLNSRLDTELILCHVLNLDRTRLILQGDCPLSEDQYQTIQKQIQQRAEGYPIAYLTGEKDFYKHTFFIKPGVLVPRPETELLVEVASEFLKGRASANVLDMGCGSGCVGLSIITEIPGAHLTAVDISKVAVEVTRQNAKNLNLMERTKTQQTDVEKLSEEQKFDCIVANPPYIARYDLDVDPGVRRFEPSEALFADEDGFGKIGLWTFKAWRLLQSGGLWATEIGHTQGAFTVKILETAGFKNIKITKDLSGKDRMVSGVKSHG